ncbi:Uma2 family endonuclease [Scytonema hofmannii]|uniref:Uma2 family endonuclease n=1 Tax=Scytonema hofmannii TaxID=34078 RepID=UPI0003628C85|nr:Uma2 family endonuclease [Scytonema hofmannii]
MGNLPIIISKPVTGLMFNTFCGMLHQQICYCIGEAKKVPDIAIEVVVTSGNIRKLEVYRRLGVSEVWFWERYQFKLYHLRDNPEAPQATLYPDTYGYEQIKSSEFLPQLDISLLEQCISISDSIQAIDEFERNINKE